VREALRNFTREITAIIGSLGSAPANIPANHPIVERIQELVLTWSVTMRPSLAAMKVPQEVLARADRMIARAARLATGPETAPTKRYLSALHSIRNAWVGQVLLEVRGIPIATLLAASPTAADLFPEIPDLPNQLVPNALQGWAEQIRKFLKKHPFEKNVFVMVSYRSELAALVDRVSQELLRLHLNPVLAKDHNLTDDLYNPIACLLCCNFGVAIFGRAEGKQMHNPNVVYELAMMQLLKRPCIILKHSKLKRMPTDLLSKLYEDYSSQKQAIQKLIAWWARGTV
jgi:hypothetical protein